MRSLEVLPSSLADLAAALAGFADAIDVAPRVPAIGGELQEALEEFARSWTLSLVEVAEAARPSSTDVVRAADLYTQLDDLLVPDVLR